MRKHVYILICLFILNSCSSIILANDNEQGILGFSFFNKIIGQWSGPVMSNTPAGNFDVWYVDFRPVSSSQVAQYSTLDINTINYLSFFVVKHDNALKIAMRSEGVFMDKGCVTYEVLDSVNAAEGYYRFSDFQAGDKRAITEFIFKGNKLTMQTFTNVFNKQETLSLHSKWDAVLTSRETATETAQALNYPQAEMVKDFSDVFRNMKESIYFTFENDPYPSQKQPHTGTIHFNVSISPKLKIKNNHEVFVMLTTKPIFDGIKYKEEKLKYLSRHMHLNPNKSTFSLINVHPGTYHVYAFVGKKGSKRYKRGDFMSSDLQTTVNVPVASDATVQINIDYRIP